MKNNSALKEVMENGGRRVEVPSKVMEPLIVVPKPQAILQRPSSSNTLVAATQSGQEQSKYAQLLGVIEEINQDIRPSYAGSRSSAERLKRCLVHARILVKDCLAEAEKISRH